MRIRPFAALGLLLLAGIARADEAPPPEPAEALWELGAVAVGVSQPSYPGSEDRTSRALLLPFLIYRGPLLRADRGSLGVRAAKTRDVELDIGFSGSLGSDSEDSDARRGMPNLGTLVEFGPRLKWRLGGDLSSGRWDLELPLRGVFDLSDGFASRGLSFAPELGYGRRSLAGWRYRASVGAVFGNRRLTDTFYGVAPAFATADRPAYEAGSGLIAWRLGLSLSRPLNRDWRVFGFTRLDSLAGAANRDSPLVRRDSGVAFGIGVSWTGWRSERLAAD